MIDTTPGSRQGDEADSLPPNIALFDTHVHLDAEQFAADIEAVLRRARRAGVAAMVCPAITAESSAAVVALAHDHADVFAAVGIQPNYTAQALPEDWSQIVALCSDPRVVAVGETGLDRHWDYSPPALQRDAFDRHLRLAQERDLPVILHCREAEADMLPMLREAARRKPLRGVMHSFSSDWTTAEQCLALGLYLSFSGPITYANRKFDAIREVAQRVPSDRILVETDSPYLTPHPLRGKQNRNEPAHVALVVRKLAELRGTSAAEVASQTTANGHSLFRLT